MSLAGIFSSSLFNYLTPQSQAQTSQSSKQQFQQEFQQLGQALQSGNLSSAQADFTTLQQQFGSSTSSTQSTSTTSASSSQSSSTFTQELNQLAQALQSGNLTAAQQDYSAVQQDAQNQTQKAHHHHHDRDRSGSGSGNGNSQNLFAQSLDQVGQALQAGNLSAAQQAYSSFQQEFPQLAQSSSLSQSSLLSSLTVNA